MSNREDFKLKQRLERVALALLGEYNGYSPTQSAIKVLSHSGDGDFLLVEVRGVKYVIHNQATIERIGDQK
jgi:hypothetical protein